MAVLGLNVAMLRAALAAMPDHLMVRVIATAVSADSTANIKEYEIRTVGTTFVPAPDPLEADPPDLRVAAFTLVIEPMQDARRPARIAS